jgi:hygromycin-B 7''-O-kinase
VQLPQNLTPKEFIETYRGKFEKWRGAIEELCLEHSVAPESIAPFTDGSNLIVSVDDRYVVKIFPPFHRHQWESEWRVLDRLWSNGLSIPIPKLIAHGQRSDHWTYVILSKLPGVTLENIWPSLDGSQKISFLLLRLNGKPFYRTKSSDATQGTCGLECPNGF